MKTSANIKYKRSKKGQVTKIYSNQKTCSIKRGHELPSYTKEELRDWLYSQKEFHEIYNTWVESNYDRNLAPSVDRDDDYKPYSFDNIEITTWGENAKKSYKEAKSGKNGKRNKIVQQFTLDGEFIAEYVSSMEAERQTGNYHSHITNNCKGKHNHIGGFIWKFKSEVA